MNKGFEENPQNTILVYGIDTVPESDYDFEKNLLAINTTTTHEIIHLAQDIMSKITGKNQAGYPSRHINQTHKNDITTKDKEHALRDIEFYPRLNDAITEFSKLAKDIFPRGTVKWFGHYTALYPDYKEQENYLYDNIGARDFYTFWELKEKDLPRWKKAVKEFYKALQEKGVLK